ncbi:MAG: hypothetical protein PHC34_09575 [Candidatus Gastranaerophilales bacterium]|nr:hypothetical protein [Candidatus Gastranaerophilales bacterium]
MYKLKKKIFILIVTFCLISVRYASAQQIIITVPNADFLGKNTTMLRLSDRYRPFNPNSANFLSTSVYYGIGAKSEVAVGVTGIDFNASNETAGLLNLGVKKVFFITDRFKLTAGSRIDINLEHTKTPYNFNFAHFSYQFPWRDLRITSGMFTQNEVPQKDFISFSSGVLLGLEVYIIKDKLYFVSDWVSRKELVGNYGIGLKYKPTPTTGIVPGILFPNRDMSRIFFFIAAAKFFN